MWWPKSKSLGVSAVTPSCPSFLVLQPSKCWYTWKVQGAFIHPPAAVPVLQQTPGWGRLWVWKARKGKEEDSDAPLPLLRARTPLGKPSERKSVGLHCFCRAVLIYSG